jgi:hypothetical protein
MNHEPRRDWSAGPPLEYSKAEMAAWLSQLMTLDRDARAAAMLDASGVPSIESMPVSAAIEELRRAIAKLRRARRRSAKIARERGKSSRRGHR